MEPVSGLGGGCLEAGLALSELACIDADCRANGIAQVVLLSQGVVPHLLGSRRSRPILQQVSVKSPLSVLPRSCLLTDKNRRCSLEGGGSLFVSFPKGQVPLAERQPCRAERLVSTPAPPRVPTSISASCLHHMQACWQAYTPARADKNGAIHCWMP